MSYDPKAVPNSVMSFMTDSADQQAKKLREVFIKMKLAWLEVLYIILIPILAGKQS